MALPADLQLAFLTGVVKDAAAGGAPMKTIVKVTPNFTSLNDLPGGSVGDKGSIITGFVPFEIDTGTAKTMPTTPGYADYSTDGNGTFLLNLIGYSDLVNPTQFTYTIEIRRKGGDNAVVVQPFAFKIPAGTTLDISALSPVKASGGSGVPVINLPQASSGPVTSSNITDATSTGRQVLTAASAADARSKIGAGTSSVAVGTGANDAKSGSWKPDWNGGDILNQPTQMPPTRHTHLPEDVGATTLGADIIAATTGDAVLTKLGVKSTGAAVVKADTPATARQALGAAATTDIDAVNTALSGKADAAAVSSAIGTVTAAIPTSASQVGAVPALGTVRVWPPGSSFPTVGVQAGDLFPYLPAS